MHVLTKIFIVLVSLLAMLLVPLVVVYSHNEDSYQQQYASAQAEADSNRSVLKSTQAAHAAQLTAKDNTIQELEGANLSMRADADRMQADLRRMESELAEAKQTDSDLLTRVAILTNTMEAGQRLEESLINELRTVRRDALTAEREKVELDEALRDALAKLDAANEARRAIREELQRWKDEHAGAVSQLAEYIAVHGPLDSRVAAGERRGGMVPDRNLEATVVAVRRNRDEVRAEIDAGSRDGVQVGWLMTIHDGSFVARLRIIEVDINRSVGIVELEDEFAGRTVKAFQRAIARKPQ